MGKNKETINNYITEIKRIFSDFSEITDFSGINEKNQVVINSEENSLSPNLLEYCFKHILKYKFEIRISEKINFIFFFNYKGTIGKVIHKKMEYGLYVDRCYKNEILKLLSEAKDLLEKLFLIYAKNAMEENLFTMENQYEYFRKKLIFFERRIEKLEKIKRVLIDKHRKFIINVNNREIFTGNFKAKDYIINIKKEIIYLIETYIDVFFSFSEHVLTLLLPFLKEFDLSKKFNPTCYWNQKIDGILEKDSNIFITLNKIRAIHRNRLSHGMFSRELKCYVNIPYFGRFPMYIGKEYLKGFAEYDNDGLKYENFCEFKEIFSSFFNYLDNEYKIGIMFVKSGLPIPVNVHYYLEGINSIEDAEIRIRYLWQKIDNQVNMDW